VIIATILRWSAPALSAMAVGNLVLGLSLAFAQAPVSQPNTAADAMPRGGAVRPPPISPPQRSAQAPQRPLDVTCLAKPQPHEHPLAPVLRWAKQGLPAIEKLNDYCATFVKRERIRGQLGGFEFMAIKIRHRPFSVYLNFLEPAKLRGQEVIYNPGQNNGNLRAHKAHLGGTVSLHPDGLIAMSGQHYPLTEIGLANLVRRLIEVGEEDVRRDECEVKYIRGAKVNKRLCTVIQVSHPLPREYFRFHLARIFVDEELRLPIRYEAYDWPREVGGSPELIEEYTYLDLKLNNGFTDEDFSTRNPNYHFPANGSY
jgi:hypothetical protein